LLLSVVCVVRPSCRQRELLRPRLAAPKVKIVGQSSLSVWSHALPPSSVALAVPKARGQRASTSPLLSALSA
jgi:hypothetical protein